MHLQCHDLPNPALLKRQGSRKQRRIPGWRRLPTSSRFSDTARSSSVRARARSPGPPMPSVAPTLRNAQMRSGSGVDASDASCRAAASCSRSGHSNSTKRSASSACRRHEREPPYSDSKRYASSKGGLVIYSICAPGGVLPAASGPSLSEPSDLLAPAAPCTERWDDRWAPRPPPTQLQQSENPARQRLL